MDNSNVSHKSVQNKNSEPFQTSSEMILEELDEVTKVFECGHPNLYSAYWMALQQVEEAHLNAPLFFPRHHLSVVFLEQPKCLAALHKHTMTSSVTYEVGRCRTPSEVRDGRV